ncbi:MAG: MlaD family protein [Kiritimatiellaeota bacterium]|nr:MlaD family protein [Kiritimatiellota bacterium]
MGARKNIFSEIVVGAFMVMVLLALVVFTALTAGVDFFTGRGRKTLVFAFDDVAGLRAQDPVIMRGMPVGKIRGITLAETGVLVEALVDDRVVLREGYSATVRPTSLLGGNLLAIEEGAGAEVDASAPLAGAAPRDLMAEVGAAVGDIRRFINAIDTAQINAILADVGATARGLSNIVARVDAGEGTVGRLLSSDDTVYNDIAAFASELREVVSRVNVFVAGLSESDGSIQRLFADDGALYETLASTLRNLDAVTTRLAAGEGTLGKLLSNDDTVYNDIAAITADLRQFMAELKKGDGTLGKLIADPSLYNNVEGLILDARGALDNFRETTPITSFGSLLMGGL